MQVSTATSDALTKYLDLTAAQLKLAASNIANVDTPGYKTQGFDFEQEFTRALQSPSAITQGEPASGEVEGLVARPDGNTVSIDRESLQLAKLQLQFRTGVELLKHQFSGIMAAIHADSK